MKTGAPSSVRLTLLLFSFLFFLGAASAQEKGLSLVPALKALNAELSWDPLSQRGRLSREERSIVFIAGAEISLLSSGQTLKSQAPYQKGSELFFPQGFIDQALSFFQAPQEKQRYTIAAIIIDPGHGGKDPGAIGKHGTGKSAFQVVEKDVNLEVGLMLRDRLALAFPDKKILMTRSTDVYPELSERTEMANSIPLARNEAIIFVSIHSNASLSKKARGFEVWYLDPDVRRNVLGDPSISGYDPAIHPIISDMLQEEFTTESILIAKSVLEGMNEQIGRLTENRGIKNKDWYVVKNARMPAVLIELSYVSNEADALLLRERSYLKKLSDGIYNGLVSFIRLF